MVRNIKENNILKIVATLIAIVILFFIMVYDVPNDKSRSTWSLPLSGHVFVIDPGHGGPDGGANNDDTQEKEVTLKISNYLRDYLNEAGALVILTRETDKDLADAGTRGLSNRKVEDLRKRVSIANESMADFFLSIHLNSIPSSKWHGAQTFYHPVREENQIMAKQIQQSLISNLKNTDRQPLAKNNIVVLKYVKMPSVMVEVGFLSNPSEAQLLKDPEYQKKIAFSIYQGMLNYYSEKDKLLELKN